MDALYFPLNVHRLQELLDGGVFTNEERKNVLKELIARRQSLPQMIDSKIEAEDAANFRWLLNQEWFQKAADNNLHDAREPRSRRNDVMQQRRKAGQHGT